MIKLTDLDAILLSAAAQRDTGSLLPAPDSVSSVGARLSKAISGLLRQGLAEERETSDRLTAHRTDGDVAHGVYITDAGKAAIGVIDGTDRGGIIAPAPTPRPDAPRVTKAGTVLALLQREEGAIRDKIAASKAKGMWMGGTPPLGYKPDGRSLAIVEEHAAVIRSIFQRYLELGNVRLVAEQLARDWVRSPVRFTLGGKAISGVPFGRGQIYSLLKCPTYAGEVHHREQIYAGLHKGIIERDVWDRTQALLAQNLQGERDYASAARTCWRVSWSRPKASR